MIVYKLLPLKINEVSHVCYSVITLDNWHLAYCDPTWCKDHKRLTVNVSLYSNKHQLHGCTVTFCFLILDKYLFGILKNTLTSFILLIKLFR